MNYQSHSNVGNRRVRRTVALCAWVAAIGSAIQTSIDQIHAATFRTVAMSGDPAPGLEEGRFFTGFAPPVLNNAGEVAFQGNLDGWLPPKLDGHGVWSEGGGEPLRLVAVVGSIAPNVDDGLPFIDFSRHRPFLSDSGVTGFVGVLHRSVGDGIWVEVPEGLTPMVLSDHPAPGIDSGENFGSFSHWQVMNDAGLFAIHGRLNDPLNIGFTGSGIWKGSSSGLQLIVRDGLQDNMTPGVSFARVSGPRISATGDIAFWAVLEAADIDDTNGLSIWTQRCSQLKLIAQTGQAAPGAGEETKYENLGLFTQSESGRIAFKAQVIGPGLDQSNNQGIWVEAEDDADDHVLIARTGTHAPDVADDLVFGDLSDPVLSDSRRIAFSADLDGVGVDETNRIGVWAGQEGDLRLIAGAGLAPPGVQDAVYFDRFSNLSISRSGQIAFQGRLANFSGEPLENDRGIWIEGPDGLDLLLREGDNLEIEPGDIRKISSLDFNSIKLSESTRGDNFNDFGQLTFKANFTDGTSGIFVADTGFVPEPASGVLVLLASLGLMNTHQNRTSKRLVCKRSRLQ